MSIKKEVKYKYKHGLNENGRIVNLKKLLDDYTNKFLIKENKKLVSVQHFQAYLTLNNQQNIIVNQQYLNALKTSKPACQRDFLLIYKKKQEIKLYLMGFLEINESNVWNVLKTSFIHEFSENFIMAMEMKRLDKVIANLDKYTVNIGTNHSKVKLVK